MNNNGCIDTLTTMSASRYAATRTLDNRLTLMTTDLWQFVCNAERHAESVSGPDAESVIDRETR